MHMADIIRTRRRELGLTQEQVAQRLRVSAPAVNKWERGVSYPDITLVPALARLLGIDANTLLSFEADLDAESNLAIQREVDRLVREEGYEAGFAFAQEQMSLYPASDELAIVLTLYLDGALDLFQVKDCDKFRPRLDEAYDRLSRSALPEVRERACGMLIARAMQEERYDDAQQLIDTIRQPGIDKEERQAALYLRQGRDEEAARLLEARLLATSSELAGVFNGIIEVAYREGRESDARECARRAQVVLEALGQPLWMAAVANLTCAIAEKDSKKTLELLDGLMTSMHGSAGVPEGPLYRHSDFNDLTQYAAQVASMVLSEVRGDGEFSFLRDCEEYSAFLAKWSDGQLS